MTALAWIYLFSTVLFFVGIIVSMRETKSEEKQAMYPTLFGLLLLSIISGLGLALGTLGALPTVTW